MINIKDGFPGTRTRGVSLVGADLSTELWRHANSSFFAWFFKFAQKSYLLSPESWILMKMLFIQDPNEH